MNASRPVCPRPPVNVRLRDLRLPIVAVLLLAATASAQESRAPFPDVEEPFPYAEQEVSYQGAAGTLTGTLTLPRGPGPFPAVLLLSGGGPQNRDYEVFGHRPFLVLADHLTRAGVAVLRVDDRGAGGSDGDSFQATLSELADDALRGAGFLSEQERVARGRIGLIGHSEGGAVATLALERAEQDAPIAFAVLLGAPAAPMPELMTVQLQRNATDQGLDDEAVERQRELQSRIVALLAADPADHVEPALRAALRQQITASPAAARLSEAMIDAAVERTVRSSLTPRSRSLLRLDPAPVLRSVRVPVLALQGSRDLQIDPRHNLAALRAALGASPSTDVTIQEIPDLNHFFQTVPEGPAIPNARIEETFAPAAMERIAAWILERFG